MNPPVIQAQGLSKRFVNNEVFNDINLSVNKGKSLAIIGGSGQGKSVLLKCIVGLMQPDTGKILFDGEPLQGKHKQKFFDSFGIVFQGAALFDSIPVWENISFKFKYSGTHSIKARRKIASQKLDLVGMPSSNLDLYPSELSGGMQKRVGIARAIATEPKILFFDEPTSGLDPITSNTINNLIRFIIKEKCHYLSHFSKIAYFFLCCGDKFCRDGPSVFCKIVHDPIFKCNRSGCIKLN